MENLDYLITNAPFKNSHSVIMKYKARNVAESIVINGLRFSKGTRKGKKSLYTAISKDYYIAKYNNKTIRLHQYVFLCYYNHLSSDKNLEIHHIDEDIYNNNISNLLLLTRKEHRKLHAKK